MRPILSRTPKDDNQVNDISGYSHDSFYNLVGPVMPDIYDLEEIYIDRKAKEACNNFLKRILPSVKLTVTNNIESELERDFEKKELQVGYIVSSEISKSTSLFVIVENINNTL